MSLRHYNAFISYSHSDCETIAPHIQKAIENIGKPWYWIGKKRLSVFRDETDLSVNPGLWDAIVTALRNSDYFILLASPKASESQWIQKEVEWWLKNKNINSLFIAVVKGNIQWGQYGHVCDFDWEKTDCLPPILKQKFVDEPLYIDLRPYHSLDNLRSIDGPGFQSQVIKIISAIVGKPPWEINSDELRRQNNIKRFLAMLGVVLIGLVVALFFMSSNLQKSNTKTRNQLARNYWDKGHQALNTVNYSAALFYAAEAIGLSSDESVTKSLLVESEAYLPGLALKNIYSHDGDVSSAMFSPDGKKILIVSRGSAILWDTESGEQIHNMLRGYGFINCAVFTADGRHILVSANYHKAQLWDITTGKETGSPLNHENDENDLISAAFTPDGKYILTTSTRTQYGGVTQPILHPELWETATSRKIATALEQEPLVYAAALSPDGTWIVTVSGESTIKLWDTRTGKQMGSSMYHVNSKKDAYYSKTILNKVIVSPDGKKILTINSNNVVRLWEAGSGRLLKLDIGLNYYGFTPMFSPDGKNLLVSSYKGVELIDVTTDQPAVRTVINRYNVSKSVVFSPDGKWFVMAEADKISLWDATNWTMVGLPALHEMGVDNLVFSPDGRYILTSGKDKRSRLWEIRKDPYPTVIMRHKKGVVSAEFSPDGHRILTASEDSTARQWEAQTGRQIGPALLHGGAVNSAAFSPDRKYILTTSTDKTARLWDAGSGRQIGTSIKDDIDMSAGLFSPDGHYFLTGNNYRDAYRLWEVKNGYVSLYPIKFHSSIGRVVFSPDGKLILTSGGGTTAELLNFPADGEYRRSLEHEIAVTSAVFTADGKRILTVSGGQLRFWDVNARKQIGPTMNLTVYAVSAALSPDGQYILILDRDERATIWHAATGQLIFTPLSYNSGVTCAVFNPDGNQVVTTGKDSTARVWHIGADLDMSPELLQTQIKMITGLELNLKSNELNYISTSQWYRIKDEYYAKARQHLKICKYPEYNLWRRFHPVED